MFDHRNILRIENVYGFDAWRVLLERQGRLSKEWKHPDRNEQLIMPHKFEAPLDKTASERHRKANNSKVVQDLKNKPKK